MSEFLTFFQPHGLIGMIVGALLLVIILFIAIIEKRDRSHAKNVREIIKDSRDERERTVERTNSTTDKLSDAIRDLANQLKK